MPVGAAPAPTVVHGSGSTFAAPILSKWASDYMASYHETGGVRVIYDSVGSGAGVDAIKAGKVDFAASDRPLSPSELAAAGLGQFPLVIGGVVPVVNLPGIGPGKLRFTGPLLADIYLGKVTRWNDRAIAALNPGIALPDLPIAVVHRSDGSGTTFNWADYLGKVSPEWKAKVGEAMSISWPVGEGAPGNDGVSAAVRKTTGAIGYVELAYVTRDHLAWAYVRNGAGQYVTPGPASFAAAAEGAKWDATKDFDLVLTDAPGAQPTQSPPRRSSLPASTRRGCLPRNHGRSDNSSSGRSSRGRTRPSRSATCRCRAIWRSELKTIGSASFPDDRPTARLERALPLHRQLGALDHRRGDHEPGGARPIQSLLRRLASEGRGQPEHAPLTRKLELQDPRLPLEVVGRVCRA
jgi:phosphate transport system substrate-binding protein